MVAAAARVARAKRANGFVVDAAVADRLTDRVARLFDSGMRHDGDGRDGSLPDELLPPSVDIESLHGVSGFHWRL